MALGNEDIDERFEIDAKGMIRWRRVSAKGLPKWCAMKAEEINRKAGEEVNFFPHTNGSMIVKLYGGTVTEARVRKVLQRQTARDEAVERRQRERARPEAVVAETAKPSRQEAERAAERRKWIKQRLGFAPIVTGEWRHPDGRKWSDIFFTGIEAVALAEEYDAMEDRA